MLVKKETKNMERNEKGDEGKNNKQTKGEYDWF